MLNQHFKWPVSTINVTDSIQSMMDLKTEDITGVWDGYYIPPRASDAQDKNSGAVDCWRRGQRELIEMVQHAMDITHQIKVYEHNHTQIATSLIDEWIQPYITTPIYDTESEFETLHDYYDAYSDFEYNDGDELAAVVFNTATNKWEVCHTLPTQLLVSSGIPCVRKGEVRKLISVLNEQFPTGVTFRG